MMQQGPVASAKNVKEPGTVHGEQDKATMRLRGVSLFSRFHDDELMAMQRVGRLLAVAPHSHAVIEGELTRGMFILLHGYASVYKTDPDTGHTARIAVLEEGASFGEMSLFDAAPRSATVVAEVRCELFQLDAEAFEGFLRDGGMDLQFRFYKTCAEELAGRFRSLNADYMNAQRLLWKHALRR